MSSSVIVISSVCPRDTVLIYPCFYVSLFLAHVPTHSNSRNTASARLLIYPRLGQIQLLGDLLGG